MAYLQTKDFTKNASAGDYAGKDRHSIVLFKIKDKKPFVLSATQTGPKVFGVTYDKTKKILVYKDTLASKKLKEVSILKVFKDKDFGGGAAGSGGGADLTRIAESAQCYYCSYAFNVAGRELKNPPTLKELGTAARYVQADMNLYDAMDKCPEDWHDVFVKTANILVRTYRNKVSGNVYFHRGSKFMQKIYEAKAEVMKADKMSDNVQAPGSFSNDKWNPGDIWMSTYGTTDYVLTNRYETWSELNQQVLEKAGKLGGKTQLLGISLKKVGASAKITEFNLPKRVHNIMSSYEGFRFGKVGNFFSSQDIYMYMSGQEVQFRTFSGDSAWQGEIKGASAAGGKIGGGNVNFYCMKHIGQNIGGGRSNNWNEKSILNRVDDERVYDLYVKFYNEQNTFQKADYPIVPKADFMRLFKEQSSNFRASKYMCMLFLETFYKGTRTQRNKVVTEMIRYAASNTDQSSYFIKVS